MYIPTDIDYIILPYGANKMVFVPACGSSTVLLLRDKQEYYEIDIRIATLRYSAWVPVVLPSKSLHPSTKHEPDSSNFQRCFIYICTFEMK